MSVNTDPPDPMCPICGKPVDIMQGLLSHHSCLFRPDDSWVKICDLSILADLRRRVEALEKQNQELNTIMDALEKFATETTKVIVRLDKQVEQIASAMANTGER